MERVTSADFPKNLGRYQEVAQREPVVITDQGRDSLVLLSASEFARLKSMDTRQAFRAADMPDDLVEALERAKAPSWTAKFNSELES